MPDKLTGLASRDELTPSISDVTTAVLLDVNSLRWLNIQGGPEVGDRALVTIAGSLEKYCERLPQSELFRIWGDEFLLVLPSTYWADAVNIATELVNEVGAQKIPYFRPNQPEIDRVDVSALVFDLTTRVAAEIRERGPSGAFREWFEALLYQEKIRYGEARGVVVDARSETGRGQKSR